MSVKDMKELTEWLNKLNKAAKGKNEYIDLENKLIGMERTLGLKFSNSPTLKHTVKVESFYFENQCYISMSSTLEELINNKKGYRTEDLSDGYRDLAKVLECEILELGNTDIIDFCVTNYNIKMDKTLKDTILSGDSESISYEDNKVIMDNILQFFYSLYETNTLYCLWLSTEEGVRVTYTPNIPDDCVKESVLDVLRNTVSDEEVIYEDDDMPIYAYNLPKDITVISDLGIDGSLYVSTIHPNNWVDKVTDISTRMSK